MLLESITAISQLFVNICTYDHLYAYDGPTTFMHLCKKKKKKKKPYISKEHKQFDPTCYEFLNRL